MVNDSDRHGCYAVEMAPVGAVEFERPPERVAHYFPDYADMAVPLGHGDSVLSTTDRGQIDYETMLEVDPRSLLVRGGPIYSGELFDRGRVAGVVNGAV